MDGLSEDRNGGNLRALKMTSCHHVMRFPKKLYIKEFFSAIIELCCKTGIFFQSC
jgi:hypothetical protein